jgi:hypothetical protein
MIKTHPAYDRLVELAKEKQSNIHTGTFYALFRASRSLTFPSVLHEQLEELRDKDGLGSFTEVTKDMHFYPDLHGPPPDPPTCTA